MADAAKQQERYQMRAPCKKCGHDIGFVTEQGSQDVVRCISCESYCYCAPRVETGKAVRSVAKRPGINPKLRARILVVRANGKCEICGNAGTEREPLHVSHLVSRENALRLGMTDDEVDSEENLCAMCAECNLGLGQETVPARLLARVVMVRIRFGKGGW
jgi:ribosomal protein S14